MEDFNKLDETEAANIGRRGEEEEERDPESNTLQQPLLKRNRKLSTNPLATVGAKVSHIESLDYE